MATFRVGDEVNTRYGPGVVLEIQGTDLRVHLHAASATVKLHEWTVTPRQPTPPPPSTAPKAPPQPPTREPARPPAQPPPEPTRATPTVTPAARAAPTKHALSPSAGGQATHRAPSPQPPPHRDATSDATTPRTTPVGARRFEPDPAATHLQAIDALRFGLVPTVWLQRLTVGYEQLESWTTNLLPTADEQRPIAAEISGPFGTGKSHACAVVRTIARERGYLVANVEVDGLHVSLSDPARLWNALTRTVHAHDLISSTPIVEVYLRAIANDPRGIRTTRDSSAYYAVDAGRANFEVVRTAARHGVVRSVAHILENHLAANPHQSASQAKQHIRTESNLPTSQLNLRPVIGRTLAQRAPDFVQALTALALAGQMAGYAGLVITVDEFEVEYNLTATGIQRTRDLIDELAAYVAGRTQHAPAPIAIFLASVGQDGHQGDAIIDHLIQAGRGERFDLEPMDADHRRTLARNIHRLYLEAYQLDAPFDPRLPDRVEQALTESGEADSSGVARAFIKQYVAALDLRHGPPHA